MQLKCAILERICVNEVDKYHSKHINKTVVTYPWFNVLVSDSHMGK
jgi:hypothetical protein